MSNRFYTGLQYYEHLGAEWDPGPTGQWGRVSVEESRIMTESSGVAEAGWLDDPEDSTQLRYWDGSVWTEHRSPKPGVAQKAAAQPGTTSPGTTRNSAPKTGAPWWLAAMISAVTLLVGMGIGFGVGVLISGDNDAVAAPATSAAKPDAPDEPTGDATMSAEPQPAAGGGAGTAADPLAIDTPWTYDTSWFGEEGTIWEGTFEGLVPLPVYEYEEDQDARCFAIIGTMSPSSIADGAFTNDTFDTPVFEVIINGQVNGDYGFCETGGIEADGYGSLWDAAVSVGSPYKFYSEVFLPSSVTGDVELIVVGSASDPGSVFYQSEVVPVG